MKACIRNWRCGAARAGVAAQEPDRSVDDSFPAVEDDNGWRSGGLVRPMQEVYDKAFGWPTRKRAKSRPTRSSARSRESQHPRRHKSLVEGERSHHDRRAGTSPVRGRQRSRWRRSGVKSSRRAA